MSRSWTAASSTRHSPRAWSLAGRRNELTVVDVARAREARPRRQHPAERADIDRRRRPSERLDEVGHVRQAERVRLEHGSVGLAEAQGIEVIDRSWTVDLAQKAAGVDAVAAAGRRLLGDGDRGAGVVRGDCGGGAGGAEADDEDVDFSRYGHPGAAVMIRSGSDPSHRTDASRTIA